MQLVILKFQASSFKGQLRTTGFFTVRSTTAHFEHKGAIVNSEGVPQEQISADIIMADAPVVFKRTKSKPAQRARTSTPDVVESTGDGEVADVDESPSTLATKLKKRIKTREKPKSRLSFGADEVRRRIAPLGHLLMVWVK